MKYLILETIVQYFFLFGSTSTCFFVFIWLFGVLLHASMWCGWWLIFTLEFQQLQLILLKLLLKDLTFFLNLKSFIWINWIILQFTFIVLISLLLIYNWIYNNLSISSVFKWAYHFVCRLPSWIQILLFSQRWLLLLFVVYFLFF